MARQPVCPLYPVRPYSGAVNQYENVGVPKVALEDDKLYKKLEIELRGHDKMVLKSFINFAVMTAEHLDITVGAR